MGLFKKSYFEKGHLAYLKNDYVQAREIWEAGAAKGESDCMLAAGSLYEKGLGVEMNLPKAFSFYCQAADKKHKMGYCYVGICYLHGVGTAKDPAKGIEYLRKAASKGINGARVVIKDYEAGKPLPVRGPTNPNPFPTDAEQAYKKALAYVNGEGVPQDISQAIHWLQIASDQNHPEAMRELADCYLHCAGGLAKDEEKAFGLYSKAAEAGNPGAQFMLSGFYMKGIGRPQDKAEAIKWIRKAADNGEVHAQVMLGSIYQVGDGMEKNLGEAFRYFSAAADQRDPYGYLMVGHLSYYGVGTEQNYTKAFVNLREAFQKGEKSAALLLGLCYLNHRDGKKNDYENAVYYFKEAVKLGLPDAEFHLACCYAKGLGVKRNQTEALRLFRKIYDDQQKEPDQRAAAACNCAVILLANNDVKRDVNAAVGYLNEAIKFGSSLALYYLGMLYYDGAKQDGHTVLGRDEATAYILLKAAAERGQQEARKYLTSDLKALIPRSTLRAQGIVGEFLSELSSGFIDALADNISF